MNYIFGHYTGNKQVTDYAIATLLEIDAVFRKHTVAELSRAPLVQRLPKFKERLYRSLPKKDYRFTVRDVSNMTQVYVYSGMTSTIDWTKSIQAGKLVFVNMMPATSSQLYPGVKKLKRSVSVA